ncbi:MAG: type II secretion system GspH family protein [Lachnospiraceae bacterium]|nr:type II secretion system GspH family protein [Lachnospiraceae bacterium]
MKENNQNRGFTLVELLITVAILAIIVAPFLATFVMASGNNLNASQKQDAANLAEDIAEEIKGKNLDMLEKTPDWNWISGPDHPSNPLNIYEFDIPSAALPTGIRSGFSAKAKLEPASNPINDKMPTLTNMNGTDTVLFMSGFYANDSSFPSASRRESTITISCDPITSKYKVSLEVEYFDSSNTSLEVKQVSEVTRDDAPSIFAVYTPMSPNDKIYFNNDLSDDDMENAEGDFVALEFYLSIQKGATIPTISSGNIIIQEGVGVSADTITNYISANLSNEDRYINIYTNADVPVAGYEKSLVKEVQSDKLYDLTVEVYYGTGSSKRKCAEFKSSKLHFG